MEEAESPLGKWEWVEEATWQVHPIAGSLGFRSLRLAFGSQGEYRLHRVGVSFKYEHGFSSLRNCNVLGKYEVS